DLADILVPIQISARSFSRAVIHNNDFQRLKGLRLNGLDRFVDILLTVIEGNDDRSVASCGRHSDLPTGSLQFALTWYFTLTTRSRNRTRPSTYLVWRAASCKLDRRKLTMPRRPYAL